MVFKSHIILELRLNKEQRMKASVLTPSVMKELGITTNGTCYTTLKHDLFVLKEGNREINLNHVEKLKSDMIENDIFTPILVELVRVAGKLRLEIDDGQHRWTARKDLNHPQPFILVENVTLEDIQILNTTQKNWTSRDFLDSFITKGFVEYKIFDKWITDNKISSIDTALVMLGKDNRQTSIDAFKHGKFVMGNAKLGSLRAAMIRSFYGIVVGTNHGWLWNKPLVTAVCTLSKDSRYNHDEFLRKIAKRKSEFVQCANQSQYLEFFANIINTNRSVKDKIVFA